MLNWSIELPLREQNGGGVEGWKTSGGLLFTFFSLLTVAKYHSGFLSRSMTWSDVGFNKEWTGVLRWFWWAASGTTSLAKCVTIKECWTQETRFEISISLYRWGYIARDDDAWLTDIQGPTSPFIQDTLKAKHKASLLPYKIKRTQFFYHSRGS